MDKEQFLKEFGKDYGYPQGPKTIDEIRSMEFKRLEGSVYLDHAGATLYSELQMEAIFRDLTSSVYGNPHSQSDSSVATSEIVQECRQQVLDYCNASAKDYRCIFTSGATAALKMVGETFPWSCHSSFMHTTENHNSVIGMREYALSKGAAASAVDIEEHVDHGALHIDGESSFKLLKRSILRRSSATFMEEDCKGNAYHLFAFPSECNFSGQKFNLELVNIIKKYPEEIFEGSAFSRGHWLVLIDAAKGCATEPPDLSKYQADFVVVSFYKLFGYPTGLGALVVRNEAAKLLKKTYFSGGTVAASIADVDFVRPRDGIEQWLEDGTTSFLNIVSLRHGFKILNALTFAAISRHVTSLATYLRRALLSLKHENGADVCVLYGEDISKGHRKMGPVVSFNLKRPDNSWFGYREVEKLASLSGIQLRTGCFCNPGACAKFLGLSQLELLSNVEAGHVCWDDYDIVNGKPTGAIRVSFGYMSMFEEAKKFVDFVVNSFVSLPSPIHPRNCNRLSIEGRDKRYSAGCSYLKSVTVYPIKSCGGFCVDSWPMSKTGLLHDREWLLETPSGEILTQKKVPEMGLINTFIDLGRGILFVESPRCRTKLQIILELGLSSAEREQMLLHGQRYEVLSYNDEVNSWFSNAVARPCMLFRCLSSDDISKRKEDQRTCRDVKTMLNFVNEAQLLLISEASVSDLNSRLHSKAIKGSQIPLQVSAMRFRPNLVISGGEPYAEDEWTKVQIGDKLFASLGGCNRCQMINFDHHSGQVQKTNEPLATLATYRRAKGRISFGVLLRYENHKVTGDGEESWLQVGQEVHPLVRQLRESL